MSSKRSGGHPVKGQSIALATSLMMAGNLVGKAASFLREILVSREFNGVYYSDAFYLADQIPAFFFSLLIGGAIGSALTPSLAKGLEQGREKEVWKSISVFITLISLIMFSITILGQFFTEPFFKIIFRKKYESDPQVVMIAAQAAKVLYPQTFFMMLAALCIGVMNAYKKFTASAFGPAIYSVCVALAIYLFAGPSEKGVVAACVGMTGSCFIYFLFQLYVSRREMNGFRLSLDLKDSGFRYLIKLAIPMMISGAFVQLNTVVLSSMTGSFDEGVVTGLNQSRTLWQLPYGIFATSVGIVMMPSLAGFYGEKKYRDARGLLVKSLRRALFLMIPCAVLFFILPENIVQVVFQWKDTYTDRNVAVTASLLRGYAAAMIAQTFVFILNQAFYAIGKTAMPLAGGILSFILTFLFSNLFIFMNLGEISLALGYSFASIVNAIFLYTVYRSNRKLAPRSLMPFLARTCICVVALGIVTALLNSIPVTPGSKIMQIIWTAFQCIAGFGSYLAVALFIRMREVRVLLDKITRLVRKN